MCFAGVLHSRPTLPVCCCCVVLRHDGAALVCVCRRCCFVGSGLTKHQTPEEAQDCMIHNISSSMVSSDCNRSASKLGYAGPAFQGCTQAGWLLQYCAAAVRASALLPCLHLRFAAQLTMPAIHKPCNNRLGLHSVCLQDCKRLQQWSR
jgi:hypothetical protein